MTKATCISTSKLVTRQKNGEININNILLVYPFFNFFEEDFYLMYRKKRNRSSQELNIKLISVKSSAVAIKRLIGIIRDWYFLEDFNLVKLAKGLYLYPLVHLIIFILVLFLPFPNRSCSNSKLEISKSVHSIFLFMEDRFTRSNRALKVDFPYDFHSETLIRVFRRQIKDVSFLHLLRIVFLLEKLFLINIYSSGEEERRSSLNNLIRNFYIFAIDSILLIPWKEICKLQITYLRSLDITNIFRKESFLLASESKMNRINADFHINRRLCVHYVRWTNQLFVSFEGTRFFTEKWFYYLRICLRFHFHFQTKSDEQLLALIYIRSVSFSGYILVRQIISRDIRIKSEVGLYIALLNKNRLCPEIPNSVITIILTQHKFCNIHGYPVGKLTWVSSTDDEIMLRYAELFQVFLFYYRASINRLRLRQLIYILQISRDNTLAVKHRSTIRMLQYRFNLKIFNEFFLFSRYNFFQKNRRVWWSHFIWYVFVGFSILKMKLR
uniref:Maturase K n=2 Tax=Haplopteris elongata TaxID=451070 RepID=A0A3G5CTC9_9MONI|nr:maturase K [Haplopteris elongata]AYW16140.1 maturase K [Haplopteris elongata]